MKKILRSTRARILLGVLAAWLAWQAWLAIAAPGKISDDIDRGSRRVNLLVTLPFTPERFHVLTFQRFGRVSGTQDQSVEVRGVDPARLNEIARHYWVSRIDPLPTDQ